MQDGRTNGESECCDGAPRDWGVGFLLLFGVPLENLSREPHPPTNGVKSRRFPAVAACCRAARLPATVPAAAADPAACFGVLAP